MSRGMEGYASAAIKNRIVARCKKMPWLHAVVKMSRYLVLAAVYVLVYRRRKCFQRWWPEQSDHLKNAAYLKYIFIINHLTTPFISLHEKRFSQHETTCLLNAEKRFPEFK